MNLERRTIGWAVLFLVMGGWLSQALGDGAESSALELHLRRRVETAEGSDRYHALTETAHWDPEKTAIVICDMWDDHHCPHAARRVAEMAPRMNQVIAEARKQGVLIIHCPSGTMEFYEDTPQRQFALAAPQVETEVPLENWCHLDKKREGKLPIDDSDGGCDTLPQPEPKPVWGRQIKTIDIAPGDAIADDEHVFYLMKQQGIENVIVMGVHTNMCVLGRPFGIRQLVYQGINVALMRDMTDTMYNPRMPPYVSHFTGTDLVIGHIEKHWGPTLTSTDFLGGKPFRFQNDDRPHLVIVMAEAEYDTDRTLPPFALEQLGNDFKLSYVYADAEERNNVPGLEVLRGADVLLVSVRRRALPTEQLQIIRAFVEAGKPVVGIRTASHAFAFRGGQEPPEGHALWPEFDHDILGGNYHLHYPNDPTAKITLAEGAAEHPILQGIDVEQIHGNWGLYKTRPLTESTTLLLNGSIPDHQPQPVAWTNKNKYGGRVFYTALGHPKDFQEPEFRQLFRNGIYWAAGLEVPGELFEVTGRVTWDGEPLQNARVTFSPKESTYEALGVTTEDGTFTLGTFRPGDGAVAGGHGAIAGEHKVTISKPKNPGEPQEGDLVPPRYSDPEQTRLKVLVVSGKNEVNFELSDETTE